ncbi:hypothetical protein [Phascolarctobacterium succinatutens]
MFDDYEEHNDIRPASGPEPPWYEDGYDERPPEDDMSSFLFEDEEGFGEEEDFSKIDDIRQKIREDVFKKEAKEQQNVSSLVPKDVGVSLSDVIEHNGFASEFASREVFDFPSGEVRKVNFCRFPEEVNGELVNFGIPKLLVNRDEFGNFLSKPEEEFCDFDKDKGLFNFFICGAKGVFNVNNNGFESLNVDNKEYSPDDLKKVNASEFLDMVPQGALLGKDREVKKDSALFQRLESRDVAIAVLKDKDLRNAFNDIKSLSAELVDVSKKFADEQRKMNCIKTALSETGFISRSYEKLFNRLFPEARSESLSGSGKVFYSVLKPANVSRRAELESCKKNIEKYQESLKSVHDKFKEQHEALNLKIRELPLEVTSKYGSRLRKLSEGLRTLSGWEDYRQSDMFNNGIHNPEVLADYRKNVIFNGNLLVKDIENCYEDLANINQINCSQCYADKIEKLSRMELIEQAVNKPDVLMSPLEAYRSTVCEVMHNSSEDKDYNKESSSVISRMMVMNYSAEEISAALKEASPCFVGKETSADNYVRKFFERNNKLDNDISANRSNSQQSNISKSKPVKNRGSKNFRKNKNNETECEF